MSIIKKYGKNIEIGFLAFFIFALFYAISKSVPLAGDDWGYAFKGANGNAFLLAYNFYFSWSGRFFSELYGFLVTPHKEIWNVLNASLFTALFLGINILVNKEDSKSKYLTPLLVMGLMLSVNQVLRIETYTWLMGTTYVIPLVLFVYYLIILKKYYLVKQEKLPNTWVVITCLMNFYICLCMENMASTILLANILILIYLWIKKAPYKKQLYFMILVSILGVCLIKFSPGANYRMEVDNAAWNSLTIMDKLATNWPYFLHKTFIDNNYLMICFSLVMILASFKNENKIWKIIFIIFHGLNLVMAVAPLIYEKINLSLLLVLFDIDYTRSTFIICSIFYVLYIIVCIIQILQSKVFAKEEALFYLLLAGAANIVMLISPIFGARSSLYTVYLLIILTCYVLNHIDTNKVQLICGIILCSYIIASRTLEYKMKYDAIAISNENRMSIIEYYRNNPDEKEAWIPRMPKGWIHSADIEEEDTYHMDTFKSYYGLNPDMKVIFFSESE